MTLRTPTFYYHPYSKHLRFDEDGFPYTDVYGDQICPWQPHPIFLKTKKGRKSPRYKISLRKQIAIDIDYLPRRTRGNHSTNQCISRLAAEAFYNKKIPEGLHVCHINGIATDNSKSNLRISDHINNAIDEVYIGRQITTVENLDLAIKRLEDLREKF